MTVLQRYREEQGVYRSSDAFGDAIEQLPIGWKLAQGSKRFAAAINQRSLDDITFATVRFSPCKCTRIEQFPVRQDGPLLCLTYQLTGRQRMLWDDREEIAEAGDIVLWSETDPMTLENEMIAKACNLWFPASLAEQRVGNIDRFIGQKLPSTHGLASFLGHNIASLYQSLGQIPQSASGSILGSSIDMIFACLPEQSRPATGGTVRSTRMLQDARAIIGRADDLNDLTPQVVARQLQVSPRYLQKAFTKGGSTFSAEVALVRLERARHALLDIRFREFSITAIAHWFGFFDCSHFTRCFKRKYGLNPSDYRGRS